MKNGIVYCAAALMLSGCNTLPSLPEDDPDSISQLADIVECEIITTFERASKVSDLNFDNWGSSYEISQNTTETNGVGVDPLTWLSPAGVTKLVYSANAKYEREAYRNGKVKFEVYVTDKTSTACDRVAKYKDIKVEPRNLKLDEWISKLARSENYARIKDFGYSVRVQVTTGAGTGPNFEDGKWTAQAGVSGKRVTVKNVDFAFSKRPSEPEPIEVIVVGRRGAAPTETIIPRRGQSRQQPDRPRSMQLPPSISRQNDLILKGLQFDRYAPGFPNQ
ncbi:hypothetical protein [Neorhizobium tomejilense]|uniref:hypothetical protein n=1 Tax=Neorhizobium tomejilense TaxID=2093828 RepID=UPI00155EBFF6|nr:hypothetical protein [Neorhizobium tomejilense]